MTFSRVFIAKFTFFFNQLNITLPDKGMTLIFGVFDNVKLSTSIPMGWYLRVVYANFANIDFYKFKHH